MIWLPRFTGMTGAEVRCFVVGLTALSVAASPEPRSVSAYGAEIGARLPPVAPAGSTLVEAWPGPVSPPEAPVGSNGLSSSRTTGAWSKPPHSSPAVVENGPQLVLPADALEPRAEVEGSSSTGIRADPDSIPAEPTLANARWVGFTPAIYIGRDSRPGTWILGRLDRQERTGWITDTSTGATTRVRFLWRGDIEGSELAILSREAATALGLREGEVTSLAVYLPR